MATKRKNQQPQAPQSPPLLSSAAEFLHKDIQDAFINLELAFEVFTEKLDMLKQKVKQWDTAPPADSPIGVLMEHGFTGLRLEIDEEEYVLLRIYSDETDSAAKRVVLREEDNSVQLHNF